MYRFRFPHFAACVCALSLGISCGKVILDRYGSYIDGTNSLKGSFFAGFLDGFFVTLLPMLLLFTLSVTVYAAPAALLALMLESAQDTYYILSAYLFLTGSATAAVLPCVFFIAARTFFTYCYLLLALRTLHFRSKTRLLPSAAFTLLRPGSRCFYRDFTGVAGLVCLFGLFNHTVFYFS